MQGNENGLTWRCLSTMSRGHAHLQEEIFGPVLSVVRRQLTRRRCNSANDHEFGMASPFIPATARRADFASKVNVDGRINVPIPVPIAYIPLRWNAPASAT